MDVSKDSYLLGSPTSEKHAKAAQVQRGGEWDEVTSDVSIVETPYQRMGSGFRSSFDTPGPEGNLSSPSYTHLLRPIKLDMPRVDLSHRDAALSSVFASKIVRSQWGSRTSGAPSALPFPNQPTSLGSSTSLRTLSQHPLVTKSRNRSLSRSYDTCPSLPPPSVQRAEPIYKTNTLGNEMQSQTRTLPHIPSSTDMNWNPKPCLTNRSKVTSSDTFGFLNTQRQCAYNHHREGIRAPSYAASNYISPLPCVPSRAGLGKATLSSSSSTDFSVNTDTMDDKATLPSVFTSPPQCMSSDEALTSSSTWNRTLLSCVRLLNSSGVSFPSPLNNSITNTCFTCAWLPYEFPLFHIATQQGCLGLNSDGQCYFSCHPHNNDARLHCSAGQKDTQHLSEIHFFIVESRGRGRIRLEMAQVDEGFNILCTRLIEKWSNVQEISSDLQLCFHRGRWLFEILKATTIRVQLVSSKGWKARRVVESFGLPYVLFPDQRSQNVVESPGCFYMTIAKECQTKILTRNSNETIREDLVVIMQSNGFGSVYTEGGMLLWTFTGKEDKLSTLSVQHLPCLLDGSRVTLTLQKQVEALSCKLFTLTYLLELKAKAEACRHMSSHMVSVSGNTFRQCMQRLNTHRAELSKNIFPISYSLEEI